MINAIKQGPVLMKKKRKEKEQVIRRKVTGAEWSGMDSRDGHS